LALEPKVVTRPGDPGRRSGRWASERAHSLESEPEGWWHGRAVEDVGTRGARAVG
jgi:hypothetical protein